ncbi:MAG: hypothetical protein KDC98_24810, partial [Planctomycetes bacterium]|nr:hypothetical protein [Planctomycetota bacterium]
MSFRSKAGDRAGMTLLFVVIAVLAASCFGSGTDPTTDGTAGSCSQLRADLIGNWFSTSGSTSTGWRFPGTFRLAGNGLFTSGDLDLAWTVVYTPPPEGDGECDGLMLLDATQLPVITYGVEISGDLLLLTNWNHSELYVRQGYDPTGLPAFRVDELDFQGGHTLTQDDGSAFAATDWTRGSPGVSQPVMYRSGSGVQVAVRGAVAWANGDPSIPLQATLRGTGPDGLGFQATLQVDGDVFTAVASSTPLPSEARQIDLAIDWTVAIDANVQPCGTTRNELLCTLATPIVPGSQNTPAPNVRHTVARIACRDAAPAATGSAAVTALWNNAFTDLRTPLRRADDATIAYYDPDLGAATQSFCRNLDALLRETSSNSPTHGRYVAGTCLAWAQLMQATLAAHGIPSTVLLAEAPNDDEILVRCWRWCPNENQPGHVYDLRPGNYGSYASGQAGCGTTGSWRVEDLDGQPGQITANPPAHFNYHAVVRVGSSPVIYDPSYGSQAADEVAHELASVVGVANAQHLAERFDPNRTAGILTYRPYTPTAAPPGPSPAAATMRPTTPTEVAPVRTEATRARRPLGWAAIASGTASTIANLWDCTDRTLLTLAEPAASLPPPSQSLTGWPVALAAAGMLEPHAIATPDGGYLMAFDPDGGALRHLQLVAWSTAEATARCCRVLHLDGTGAGGQSRFADLFSPHLLRHGAETLLFAAANTPGERATRTYVGAVDSSSTSLAATLVGTGVDPCAAALGDDLVCVTRDLGAGD